jgi:hypothetical protein
MNWVAVFLASILSGSSDLVSFDTEIVPVLTKSGCNAGSCHGAATGRGGFRLSLWGADPGADFDAIVHEFEGRRIHRPKPSESLLLAKATGEMEHGGGVVLTSGGPGFMKLSQWIMQGARRVGNRQVVDFEVSPRHFLADRFPDSVTIKAIARFADGLEQDVTAWTVFQPLDPSALEVGVNAELKTLRRGQHFVLARFMKHVVAISIVVPYQNEPGNSSRQPRSNFIDDEVLRRLGELHLDVSPPASDSNWLRRVTLDLTGRLPTPQIVRDFLVDTSPQKRQTVVDALLASDAFIDFWTLRFAKWLRLHSLPNEPEVSSAYGQWLRQQIANGAGLDSMARELLTATGDSHEVGPANFSRMSADARGQADLVADFFMGARLGCANCHDHPLDKWTQNDYHGLAAIFARVERGREVRLVERGGVSHPKTGQPAVPRIPGDRDLSGVGDPRAELAEWLISKDRSIFARAMVNRIWQSMFGRGLVEPVDDIRVTNPPTHPRLLDTLADDLISHDYNFRRTLRIIALSHTYGRGRAQLSGNQSDDRFYSYAYRRPLLPEVMADAIADVTDVSDAFVGYAEGTRAIQIWDPLSPAPSLDILGRCSRVAGCDEIVEALGGLPSQLHLLNGDLINRKLTAPNGRLQRLVADGATDAEIVHEFFLWALGRHPSPEESLTWIGRVAGSSSEERVQKLEDFVWAMLSSRSFRENH